MCVKPYNQGKVWRVAAYSGCQGRTAKTQRRRHWKAQIRRQWQFCHVSFAILRDSHCTVQTGLTLTVCPKLALDLKSLLGLLSSGTIDISPHVWLRKRIVFFNICLLWMCVCVCIYVCRHAHLEVIGQLVVLSSHHMGSRDQTQVVRLGGIDLDGKHL